MAGTEDGSVRFGILDGETEEDGWTFDGLDWVKWDDEDNCWVFDGEELALKDEKNNIYVQRGDKLFLKDAETAQLYDEHEDGSLIPVDDEGFPLDETGRVPETARQNTKPNFSFSSTGSLNVKKSDASEPPPVAPPADRKGAALAKWERALILGLLDDRSWSLPLSQTPAPTTSVDRYTKKEYHAILTANQQALPALSECLRQIQYIARRIMDMATRGKATHADKALYHTAALLLDVFDPSVGDVDPTMALLRPSLEAMLRMDEGGDLPLLNTAMKRRVRTLLQSRLKICADRLAVISSKAAAPSPADACLFRMARSMRTLILQAERRLQVL